MEEDGFRVVAGGVSGGDQAGAGLPGCVPQKGVAHLPGSLLDAASPQAGLGGYVARACVQRDGRQTGPVGPAVRPAAQLDKLLHKPLVPIGFRPSQPVVVVGGGQGEVHPVPQPVEHVEHCDGVRAPGYGAQHRGAAGNQVLLPDEAFYLS